MATIVPSTLTGDSSFFPLLGSGEREALELARQSTGSFLLTDDLAARAAAEALGIPVVPTIRILSTAASLSILDFEEALHELQQTNFRVSAKVIDRIRQERASQLTH